MADLIYELVHSNEPMLWELGHYLTDNLILKIGLYFAEKNGITYSYTNFPEIFNNHIEPECSALITYDKIEPFHKRRNSYQHDFDSIDTEIRKDFAIDYYDLGYQIMFLTGLTNDEFITSSQFLKQEIQYLKGIDILDSQWEEFINQFYKLDDIWRIIKSKRNIKIKEDDNKKKFIIFYIRSISKICGGFEVLSNYSTKFFNDSLNTTLDNFEALVSTFQDLINCDMSRLKEVYHLRETSSDHLRINRSLEKIQKLISNGRDEFSFDDIILPFENLGYNINIFIRRYISHITLD